MRSIHILLLEDELQLAKIVAGALQSRGYHVTHLSNGRLGLEEAYKTDFDLFVVDVMMPFMDGFHFVREIRKTDTKTPVLFLTARSQDKDIIEGYGVGGNDYLRKPFSLEELLLRIRELLRRNTLLEKYRGEALVLGSFRFLPQRQELINARQEITRLSHRESELLYLLVQHKNQLLDRKATLLKLWGEDNVFAARTMDVFITKIRKHLQEDPTIEIVNVRGQGYKLLA